MLVLNVLDEVVPLLPLSIPLLIPLPIPHHLLPIINLILLHELLFRVLIPQVLVVDELDEWVLGEAFHALGLGLAGSGFEDLLVMH